MLTKLHFMLHRFSRTLHALQCTLYALQRMLANLFFTVEIIQRAVIIFQWTVSVINLYGFHKKQMQFMVHKSVFKKIVQELFETVEIRDELFIFTSELFILADLMLRKKRQKR